MGIAILLLLLLYKFIHGTFEYEKVTRFEMVLIPAYSLVMMVITLKEDSSLGKIIASIMLLILGILIGLFQLSGVRIKTTGKVDQFQRPVVLVKRNWSYLIGWIIVFILIIIFSAHYNPTLNHNDIIDELFTEIIRDLFAIAYLNIKNEWFVWVLNVATSFTYDIFLAIHYPLIRQAIRRHH